MYRSPDWTWNEERDKLSHPKIIELTIIVSLTVGIWYQSNILLWRVFAILLFFRYFLNIKHRNEVEMFLLQLGAACKP
jgi:hypothetical protein